MQRSNCIKQCCKTACRLCSKVHAILWCRIAKRAGMMG